ncbi:unnamed protein product [Mytilus coruscus]|uniref:Uncharacterized protein n=1 Tax=Mytilus coruscus TaxID=42192 RepID=A0A6J8BM20_MYTCO|nr:unnamed protein product [Mytilus coruscus]
MTSIIYSVGKDRFGFITSEKRERTPCRSNRRQKKITEMRGDLRRLKKRYRDAMEEERAETHRSDRKKRAKERVKFTAHPFRYMKRLFGARGSGKLENSKEEVEEHLRKTHNDERRKHDLKECEKLATPEKPKELLDESELKTKEVQDVLKKARAASATRPNAAMNLIVKSVEKPSRGPLISSGLRQPLIRAFMDDMTVTAKTVIEGNWTLEELEGMISWARMKFKPTREKIPTLEINQRNAWGKKIDATLADSGNTKRNTNASGTGRLVVENRQKWSARKVQSLDVSTWCLAKNTDVGSVYQEVSARKWKADEAVKEAETRLRHSVTVGVPAVERQGFGMTTKPRWDTADEKAKRDLVQLEVRHIKEESRNMMVVGMKQQGNWLN